MCDIDIQWVGHRKDGSSRGSVWGWFVKKGHPTTPAYVWPAGYGPPNPEPVRIAYIFRGRIGRALHIEEHVLTNEFKINADTKQKNYKQVAPEDIMSKWGKVFDDEFSMFKMMMKLRA